MGPSSLLARTHAFYPGSCIALHLIKHMYCCYTLLFLFEILSVKCLVKEYCTVWIFILSCMQIGSLIRLSLLLIALFVCLFVPPLLVRETVEIEGNEFWRSKNFTPPEFIFPLN